MINRLTDKGAAQSSVRSNVLISALCNFSLNRKQGDVTLLFHLQLNLHQLDIQSQICHDVHWHLSTFPRAIHSHNWTPWSWTSSMRRRWHPLPATSNPGRRRGRSGTTREPVAPPQTTTAAPRRAFQRTASPRSQSSPSLSRRDFVSVTRGLWWAVVLWGYLPSVL